MSRKQKTHLAGGGFLDIVFNRKITMCRIAADTGCYSKLQTPDLRNGSW
jgi:hypothetical protein